MVLTYQRRQSPSKPRPKKFLGIMNELNIITKTKKLITYITEITEKSPVKYRHTYVAKMDNLCMKIIENLYLINDTDLNDKRRLDYQKLALTKFKVLDYVEEVSSTNGCILFKQYEFISKMIYECLNLLTGWIQSDNKRLGV